MHLHKMSMLAAGGVGYVLGTRAGRGRYEQIRHAVHDMPETRKKAMAAAECVRHGDFAGAMAAAGGQTAGEHRTGTGSSSQSGDLPTRGPAGDVTAQLAADPESDPSRAPQSGPVASPYDVGWPGDDPDLRGPA